MSVRARQAARNAERGPTTYGQQVLASRQSPSPEPFVNDVDGNPIYGWGNIHQAITEGRIDVSYEDDAPEPVQDPVIDDPADAFRLANLVKDKGPDGLGQDRYDKAIRMLRKFEQDNPGAVAQYKDQVNAANWIEQNVDTTPHPSSRLRTAQAEVMKRNLAVPPTGVGLGVTPTRGTQEKMPKSLKDLPAAEPGSRAEVLDREEKAGLDTSSGITTFAQEFNLARKVNGANAQFQMLYGLAKDKLDNAGVELPKGIHPINLNEDLGQLEALVPTEDGKVRRVLVDPEFLRVADLGNIGDIEELMAGVGSVLSQLPGAGTVKRKSLDLMARKHPALAEFVGDFGWRNTGIVIEGLLDAEALGGDTGIDDLVEALDKSNNIFESGANTAFSRIFGRVFGNTERKGDIARNPEQYWREGDTAFDTDRRAQETINANLKEASDTLEELQRLTDTPFAVDRGQASDSGAAIQQQRGREARMKPAEQGELEVLRARNKEALADAVDNVHNNNLPTNPAADPKTTTTAIEGAVRKRATDAEDFVVTGQTFGDQAQVLKYDYRQGTGHLKQSLRESGSDLSNMQSGATVTIRHDTGQVILNHIADDAAFPGNSTLLVDRIMTDLADEVPPGYIIGSDDVMSPFSRNMMEKMNDQGFTVVKTPDSNIKSWVDDAGVVWEKTRDGTPLYEITEVPGWAPRVKLLQGMGDYEASRLEHVLADDLEKMAGIQDQAKYWNDKLKATIGWQPEREKSIYYLTNPPTSQLNRFAKTIEARVERSLTGQGATEADNLLRTVFRKASDEEGYPILEGLTDPNLDVGQFLKARTSLESVFERTGDAEVGALVRSMDDMLANRKILDSFGNPVDDGIADGIRSAVANARSVETSLRHVESRITSNSLFKRNDAGEFINTDLKEVATMLRSGSKFHQHLKPWMQSNPNAITVMQDALMQVYEDQVMKTGFTRNKHLTFLRNYDTALREMFTPADMQAFRATNFSKEGQNIFAARVARARQHQNRLDSIGEVKPGAIVKSFNEFGSPVKVSRYIRELEKINPKLAAQIRADGLEETRRMMNDLFFGPTATTTPLHTTKELNKFITQNEDTLRALYGNQYVTDLRTIYNAHKMDTRRFRLGAIKPELQPDAVRVTRTLLGPLSKLQRRISAANWLALRANAKRALDVYSDPAKLRQLKAVKGLPSRSRPGVAALVRVGIIPGTGWDGTGEIPADAYEKGLAWLDWLYEMEQEAFGETE